MSCREAIGLLAEYLDATLATPAAGRLEAHLADCDECRAYLRTYRAARDLAVRAGRVEMPAAMRVRLRRFLLEHLERAG